MVVGKEQGGTGKRNDGGNDPETSWDLSGSLQGKDGDLCWFGFFAGCLSNLSKLSIPILVIILLLLLRIMRMRMVIR